MIKQNKNQDTENKIMEILGSGFFMSISQITKKLKEKYNVKISPQIIKRYLLKLESEGKITKKNG